MTAPTLALERQIMDLEELKTQHPAVYKAAMLEGSQKEHERIVGHLTFGEATGVLQTALSAIENGSELTPQIAKVYMSASRNRADIAERQEDCDLADSLLVDVQHPASGFRDDFGEKVLARLTGLVGGGDQSDEADA